MEIVRDSHGYPVINENRDDAVYHAEAVKILRPLPY
jgi:hypothetical protein